jgi:prophage regulatory protein
MGERPLPYWPRFLRAENAAAYLGMSASHFRTVVAAEVSAVTLGPHLVGWLREDLDAWLDGKAGRTALSETNPWDALTDARRAPATRP